MERIDGLRRSSTIIESASLFFRYRRQIQPKLSQLSGSHRPFPAAPQPRRTCSAKLYHKKHYNKASPSQQPPNPANSDCSVRSVKVLHSVQPIEPEDRSRSGERIPIWGCRTHLHNGCYPGGDFQCWQLYFGYRCKLGRRPPRQPGRDSLRHLPPILIPASNPISMPSLPLGSPKIGSPTPSPPPLTPVPA